MYRRLRDLREDNDVKQETLAKLLGVSQATYSRYECGDIELPVKALLTLAQFYQTSTDYLLDRTDEPKPYPEKTKRHS